jgi:hypothetical protein
MTQLANIILTANSWCAVLGMFIFGAALVGLILQQEIPHEWMSRLSRIAAVCALVFLGFALGRHYGASENGWAMLNASDAFLAVLVVAGIWALRLRDEPDVEYSEALPEDTPDVVNVADLGAYINSNHTAPAKSRMVIDQPAGD